MHAKWILFWCFVARNILYQCIFFGNYPKLIPESACNPKQNFQPQQPSNNPRFPKSGIEKSQIATLSLPSFFDVDAQEGNLSSPASHSSMHGAYRKFVFAMRETKAQGTQTQTKTMNAAIMNLLPSVISRAVARLGVRHPPGQIPVGKSIKSYIQSANWENLLSSIRAVLCDSKKPLPEATPTSRQI